MDLQLNPVNYAGMLQKQKTSKPFDNKNNEVNNPLYMGEHYKYETPTNYWGIKYIKPPYEPDLHCVPKKVLSAQERGVPILHNQKVLPHFS